jgi:uncharacterized membrane protein
MPFCIRCGNQVGPADAFCGRCGARQQASASPASPAGPGADPLAGMPPRTASILCYIPVVGWIASVVVLASDRFRDIRPVRFHAFQGLYLGVAWVLNGWVLGHVVFWGTDIRIVHDLVNLALLGMSIFMMVKAAHGEEYSLPVFGELAQRSIAEN